MWFKNTLQKIHNQLGLYKIHMCPEVHGRLTDNGKPLVNVKIERSLSYSDGKYVEDSAMTDDNGCFFFPEVNIRSNHPSLLIVEQNTSQSITCSYHNEEYVLWGASLLGNVYREDFALKLASLNGDIANKDMMIHFSSIAGEQYRNRARGICRWATDCELIDPEKYFDFSHVE